MEVGSIPRCYALVIVRSPISNLVRAGEWWEYKLVPIFAAFYATALTLDVSIAALWPAAVTLLLALIPGAAYVSVINDLTDREEDVAAGKPNRFATGSPAIGLLVVAITVSAGLLFSWLWRDDVLLLTVYLSAWLAFSLYSLPPFRWKTRGIAGVLCDASGANLFPTLVAVAVAYRAAGRAPDPAWLVAVGAWAFANGIRGILWHQLGDRENDRKSGVRTFAERHPPRVAVFIGTWIAFPFELVALAVMLWKLQSVWPAVFLAFYAQTVRWRVYSWRMNPVVVAPKPRFLIVLHEYYDVHLPIAILIASALAHRLDFIVLAAHLVLFPIRTIQTARDVGKLLRARFFGKPADA
jgi:4-hydroxybenzoate polyprenyltransferase